MRDEILKKLNQATPEVLNLDGLNIQNHELAEIFASMQQRELSVTTLNLDNNQLDDAAADVLYEHLPTCQKLETLNLQFNALDIEGIRKLFRLKNEVLPHLEICLHGNKIQDEAVIDELLNQNRFMP